MDKRALDELLSAATDDLKVTLTPVGSDEAIKINVISHDDIGITYEELSDKGQKIFKPYSEIGELILTPHQDKMDLDVSFDDETKP